MKTYELNAKKENKEKGNADGSEAKAQPSAAVAAALAQQQAHKQANDPATRGGNNSTQLINMISLFQLWFEQNKLSEAGNRAEGAGCGGCIAAH